MGIQIPPEIASAVSWAAGGDWPKPDEDQVRAVGAVWKGAARELDRVAAEVDPVTARVLGSVQGAAATAFSSFMSRLRHTIPSIAGAADDIGTMSVNTALQVEYAKYMILAQSAWLAAEIVALSSSLYGSALIPAEITAVRLNVQLILRRAFNAVVSAAVTQAAMDAAVQGIQFLKGDRTEWDVKGTVLGAAMGGLGGAIGMPISLAGSALAPTFSKTLAGHAVTGAVSGVAVGAATNAAFDAGQDLGLAAAAGAIGGAAGWRHRPGETSRPGVEKVEGVPAAPEFSQGVTGEAGTSGHTADGASTGHPSDEPVATGAAPPTDAASTTGTVPAGGTESPQGERQLAEAPSTASQPTRTGPGGDAPVSGNARAPEAAAPHAPETERAQTAQDARAATSTAPPATTPLPLDGSAAATGRTTPTATADTRARSVMTTGEGHGNSGSQQRDETTTATAMRPGTPAATGPETASRTTTGGIETERGAATTAPATATRATAPATDRPEQHASATAPAAPVVPTMSPGHAETPAGAGSHAVTPGTPEHQAPTTAPATSTASTASTASATVEASTVAAASSGERLSAASPSVSHSVPEHATGLPGMDPAAKTAEPPAPAHLADTVATSGPQVVEHGRSPAPEPPSATHADPVTVVPAAHQSGKAAGEPPHPGLPGLDARGVSTQAVQPERVPTPAVRAVGEPPVAGLPVGEPRVRLGSAGTDTAGSLPTVVTHDSAAHSPLRTAGGPPRTGEPTTGPHGATADAAAEPRTTTAAASPPQPTHPRPAPEAARHAVPRPVSGEPGAEGFAAHAHPSADSNGQPVHGEPPQGSPHDDRRDPPDGGGDPPAPHPRSDDATAAHPPSSPVPEYLPAPDHAGASPEQQRHWEQAQRELHGTYEAHLTEAARVTGEQAELRGRLDAAFTRWSSRLPEHSPEEFAVAVRRRAEEVVRAELAAGPESRERILGDLHGRLELAAVREAAVRVGTERFERTVDVASRQLTAPGEEFGPQPALSREMVGRAREHLSGVFRDRVEKAVAEAYRTPDDVGENLPARTVRGERALDRLTAALPRDLDLRVGFETALDSADRAVEHTAGTWRNGLDAAGERLLEQTGVGADAGVSQESRRLLRTTLREQVESDFTAVFSSVDSADDFHGSPQGAVADFNGRFEQRLQELPRRFAVQAVREAAIRTVLDTVHEAAGVWHEQGLPRLDKATAETFGLSGPVPEHLADRVAAEMARGVDGRLLRTRDAETDAWGTTFGELTASDRIHDLITLHSAREHGFRAAEAQAHERVAAWRASHRVSDDAAERVREGHSERVREAFDEVFPTPDALRGDGVAERLQRWRETRRALDDDLAVHLAFEHEVMPALEGAARGFDALAADKESLPFAELSDLKERYGEEWFTAYREHWGPERLDADKWLAHEAAHENTFRVADRTEPAEHWSAQSPSPFEGGRALDDGHPEHTGDEVGSGVVVPREHRPAEEPSGRERGGTDVRPQAVRDPDGGPPPHEADRWPTSRAPEGSPRSSPPSGEPFHATAEIAFGKSSKRVSDDQLPGIRAFSASIAAEAVRRATHDEKPLRVYVEGGGNGSRWGSLRGTSNGAADPGLERARAVWNELRSRLNEEVSRLWGGDPDILTGTSLLQAPLSRGQGESAGPGPRTPMESLPPAEAREARRTVRIWAAADGPARVLRLLAHDGTQLDADRREALIDYVDESARRGQDARVRLLLRRLELHNLHALRGELDSRYAERIAEIAPPAGALTPVPKDVHFFWIGREPSAGALNNLEAWARSAGSTWRQHLWTDATYDAWSGEVRTRLEQIATVHQDALDALHMADRPQVREVYETAVANEAYNLASDIVRYLILEQIGGVYADVDLHPGTVDLSSMGELTVRAEDLPLLAPRVRDMDSVADALAKAGVDAPADRNEQVDLAARLRWDAGVLGNHLIVAPPGSEFVTSLLDAIPKNFDALRKHMAVSFADASQFSEELKNLAPQISGPGMIEDRIPGGENFPPLQRFAMKAGAEGVAAFDGSSYPTFQRKEAIALFSPRALAAFQGIRWVTAESERRLDGPAVRQPVAEPSVGMAPLRVPEGSSDAPALTRPARRVPLPADPSTWSERRKEVPEGYVGRLRTERFDPAVDAMSGRRPPGTLAGSQTLVRAEVSRIQATNRTWVRDHVVTLPVRLAGSGLSEHDLAGLRTDIQKALDEHVNDVGYALPRSGDQFHVELRLVHDDDHPEHVRVRRSDDPGRSDQRHWNLGPPTEDHRYLPVVFHEVFHYLGLPDEYRDPGYLFRRDADSTAVRTDGVMADTTRLAPLPERYLAAVEDTVDAGVVLHGHALRDQAADPDRPGTGASSHHDGWPSAVDWESERWATAPSPRPEGADATHPAVPVTTEAPVSGPSAGENAALPTSVPVAFAERSKTVEGPGKQAIDQLADALAERGLERWRSGRALPEAEVVGYGNGKRRGGPEGESQALRTGAQRAEAAAEALRDALAERLLERQPEDGPRLLARRFMMVERSAGSQLAQGDGAGQGAGQERILRRRAVVSVDDDPGQVVLAGPGERPDPVPRNLHLVWLGGELGPAARANVEEWSGRTPDTGWRLNMWADSGARHANEEFFQGIAAHGALIREVDEGLFTAADEHSGEGAIPGGDNALALFHLAVGNGAHAMASDIARYALLYREGGVYLDVDLAPGQVQLPTEDLAVSSDSVPFFSPAIRDRRHFDWVLDQIDRERREEGYPVVQRLGGEGLQAVIEKQYSLGELGNNLIVAPPASSFLGRVLRNLPDGLAPDSRLLSKDLKKDAASVTGPWLIKSQIESVLRDSGQWPPNARWGEAFGSGRLRFDERQRALWDHLGWLTEESERQETHQPDEPAVEQQQPAAGPSVGSAPLHGPDGPSGALPRAASPHHDGWPSAADVPRTHGPASSTVPHRGWNHAPRFVVRSAFDVRAFRVGGTPVTDLTVRIAFRDASPHDSDAVWQRVKPGVAEFFNHPVHHLPDSSRLHVTVERVTAGQDPHLTVDIVGHDRLMDQRNWWPDAEPIAYAHELAHQLGLRDEYQEGGASGRPQINGSLMGDFWGEAPDGLPQGGLRGRHLQLLGALVGDTHDQRAEYHSASGPVTEASAGTPGGPSSNGSAPTAAGQLQDGGSAPLSDDPRWHTARSAASPTLRRHTWVDPVTEPVQRPASSPGSVVHGPRLPPSDSPVRAADDREIIDSWRTRSTLPRVRRSDALRRIDTAVDEWANGSRRLPGDHAANQRQLGAILDAVDAWKAGKTGPSDRAEAVDRLTAHVRSEWDDLHQRIAERAHQAQLLDRYARIHPDLREFAGRHLPHRVDPANNTTHTVFTGDRTPTGALSDDALEAADGLARRQLATKRDTAAAGGVTVEAGVSADRVRELMDGARNKLTGSTLYPELHSYLDRADQAQALDTGSHLGNLTPVVEDVHGTRVTVHGDPTDSLRDARIDNFRKAVVTVQDAGFHVPDVELHLPKYGRLLEVHDDRVVEQSGGRLQRAEYLAPNAVIASPDVVGNPLTGKLADDRYRYLSTELDPSGVGTMVHELGHFLHYANARAQYHDLAFTEFAGRSGQGGDAVSHRSLALGVSAYAAGNPREFVAEVFTGLVYGKPFPPEVMRMYHGFGGPDPTPNRAPSVAPPAPGDGPAIAPRAPRPPAAPGSERALSESNTAFRHGSTAEHGDGPEPVSEGRAPLRLRAGDTSHAVDLAQELGQNLDRPIDLILDSGIEKRLVPGGADRSGAVTPTGSVGLPAGTAQDTDPARSEAAPPAVVTEVPAPETDPSAPGA